MVGFAPLPPGPAPVRRNQPSRWRGRGRPRARVLRAVAAGVLAASFTGAAAGPAASAPAAAAGPAATAAAPTVTMVRDTRLDPAALYFVSYDGLVNNESFQQSGILTHAGHQYAAWYTASRAAVLARRRLPAGDWQTLELPHRLSTDDAHNVISMGISPSDGRLHVAMDTHNSPVYYVKSEAGLVSDPVSRTWTASRFGAVGRTLDGLDLGAITYPQFLVTPDDRLQLSYRTGGSGNGTMELAEYDGTWRALGRWQAAGGSYSYGGATSTTRNLYPHGLGYGPGGRLHVTFTWREGNTAILCSSGGLANHDTGYVYSDDAGRTWRNGAGQLVGVTGSSPQVSVSSPGLVVDAVTVDHGLMNQESQDVDSAGQPHALISYVPGRFTQCVTDYADDRTAYARPFHVYRDRSGTWHKVELPVAVGSSGRSQLLFDSADNAYVVMPFGRIVTASKASGWTDWTVRFDGAGLDAFGEVLVDRVRMDTENVLSVMYQQRSSGTTPSPIRVADFRLC